MRVLIFSDIHGDMAALKRAVAEPADIYIAAGDLSTFGRGLDEAGKILEPLGQRCWVLPGNHETSEQIRKLCYLYNLVDFHHQIRELGETLWAGLGYSNPTPFDTPGEYTEDEIGEALKEFDGIENLRLVVHFPPYKTMLDSVGNGTHAGSPTLREWVERTRPAYLFCGHIHECAGQKDTLGATKCFNVGKQGYVLEF